MDLDVIIISHNHGQYLKDCLNSLFHSANRKFGMFLIINDFKDKESLKIAKKFPGIKIIVNNKPQGLSRNINSAIKKTDKQFLLILNPDTVTTKGALEKLVVFMEKNNRVGICGPKLVFPNGQLQYSARRFPTLKTFLIRRTPLRFFLKNSSENRRHLGYDLNHLKCQEVDWLLGACLMLRRKAIKDIGLFDERYYLYVEDIDYCWRAWRKGWEVWYVPEAVIIHHHRAESDKKLLSIYSWYHLKSMIWYYLKNILGIVR